MLALSLALVWMLPPSLKAQSVPPNKLLLVHGFGANGNDWASLEALLIASIPNVQIHRPNLNSLDGFAVAAGQLLSILGPTDTMGVAVGHSAGGIAARELDRMTGGRLRGILTVGSPLQGAAIAKNASFALGALGPILDAITDPLQTYFFTEGWPEWMSSGFTAAAYVTIVYNVVETLTSITGQQIAQSSNYMETMNGPANMQREAASGLKRLAIVNETDPSYQFCRNVDLWLDCTDVQNALWGLYTAAHGYYSSLNCDPGDEDCEYERLHADQWLTGANVLTGIDALWCVLIDADMVGPYECRADGLIAAKAQSWGGIDPAAHRFNGPNHSAERTDNWVKLTFRDLLLNNFNWPAPPPPPPPPPSVEILGQTSIAAGAVCTWTAYVTGATGSITYQWGVDGQPVGGNSDHLTYGSPNPPFEIQVTVTAANGTFGNSLYVDYDAWGWCQ